MDIKGKVHEISTVQQISDSFKKRELVVEYIENPQYPEYLLFEVTQDRCAMLDTLKVGDNIEVFFNLRGRAWTNKEGQKKYFNSMQAWRINVINGSGAGAPSAPTQEFVPPPNLEAGSNDEGDDLPF